MDTDIEKFERDLQALPRRWNTREVKGSVHRLSGALGSAIEDQGFVTQKQRDQLVMLLRWLNYVSVH